jgi:hypothetical protein
MTEELTKNQKQIIKKRIMLKKRKLASFKSVYLFKKR